MIVSQEVREMPAPHLPEFRRRALDLVAQGTLGAQTARHLGISESCLRNWMNRDANDSGAKPGLTTTSARRSSTRAAGSACCRWRTTSSSALRRTSPGRTCPKKGFRLVQELAADGISVAVACRFLSVSTSGYSGWASRPSTRATSDYGRPIP
ncbi:helix-turn-helix domain-containing protein [Microbacterium gallinarum]|uniref:helix-turn-helix domain-containing protein n=1 Tax=Microbacterium gallinarum TaxID=2762209 RepID=UPI00384C54C7